MPRYPLSRRRRAAASLTSQSQHVMHSLEPRRLLSTVVALTADTRLLKFDSAQASAILSDQPVTGLQSGETLLGIDVRPATGQLYGLGSTGRLYTIDANTGVATLKSTLSADSADLTNPFTALSGTEFGIDFNPVADRLRVVSDTGASLRVIPDSGLVTTDTPLAYDPADPTGGGKTPIVVDAAYTNDVAGATTTTLFAIDRSFYNMKTLVDNSTVPAMSFVTIGGVNGNPSPNTGVLTTTAAFGRDGVLPAGFDIAPDGTAYTGVKADFASGTRYLLVQVDPNSPVDSSHGNIGDGTTAVTDIAVIPSVQFSTALIPATEGNVATVTVTRTGGNVGTFTVDYATVGGTARAGADFTPASGTLTFAPADTSKTFTVNIADDAVAEDDEFFSVTLSNPTGGAALGDPAGAAVRISANDDLDDEPPTARSVLLTGPSRGITGAVVRFSEDMDPAAAQNAANYTYMVKGKGKRQTLTITSAVYDPATRSTTLTVAPFMQTDFTTQEVRFNNRSGGLTDTSGNPLSKTTTRFAFRVFSGTSVTFTDRDGDQGTITIDNGGRIDGIMPLKAPRTQRTQFWILDPIALRSTLSGTVQRSPRGDGIVVIAEIIGLDKKEFTPLLTNTSFRVNTLTFSSNATGIG